MIAGHGEGDWVGGGVGACCGNNSADGVAGVAFEDRELLLDAIAGGVDGIGSVFVEVFGGVGEADFEGY